MFAVFRVILFSSSVFSAQISSREVGDQFPGLMDALKILRGDRVYSTEQIQKLLLSAQPGQDYPDRVTLPQLSTFDCSKFRFEGFYVDDSSDSKCQLFYRCDANRKAHAFLCPPQTLFNQITLVCDWYYNVACSNSREFFEYSNSRLSEVPPVSLLDDVFPPVQKLPLRLPLPDFPSF